MREPPAREALRALALECIAERAGRQVAAPEGATHLEHDWWLGGHGLQGVIGDLEAQLEIEIPEGDVLNMALCNPTLGGLLALLDEHTRRWADA